MIKFNYHSHTTYCDGINTMEEMVESAIEKGLKYYGISSHAPVPFETDWTMPSDKLESYLAEVDRIKGKYGDRINIFKGLEIDYIPGIGAMHIDRGIIEGLDYIVGSVHYLAHFDNGVMWTVDYNRDELEQGIKESFGGNTREAVEFYYKCVGDMALELKPDILGHLDLIKKSNSGNYFFDEKEKWYVDAIMDCLGKIKEGGSIVEVNSGGKARGYTTEYYPSDWIISEMIKVDIPMTVSGDSHTVEGVDYEFEEMLEKLRELGCEKVKLLTENGWEDMDIREVL
ncbi:histidinol-phosphatase (PHP family) [Dethiosulfatibacter aminovorans DSM 17477]|uniref:Histidinol-phosphatase n=1 Tax=Dethiosulfatibacter aminovorans DSM 17477 TaxID=1121476 RepID=A0A1M6FN59_9FIRM|nr:histidinol-phosphatase HisJ [Dethiosulfatibacter aminovorans]SHI99083.1 histidinol-phosphatase (PHP family) [Dethiosulfatibacter aminovorans DSM 17477]